MSFSILGKKNILWNSASYILLTLLGLVSYTLNLKSFDSSIFGAYIIIFSILGIGSSIDFGFGISTVKHLSEAKKNNDENLINSIFNTFFIVYLTASVILGIIFGIYFIFFFANSNIENALGKDNEFIIFVYLLISFTLNYISGYLRTAFEGLSEFILLSKVLLAAAIINVLLMGIIYIYKLSVVYLALFSLITSSFTTVLLIFVFVISNSYIKINLKYFKYELIKKYAVYSLNIQISFFITNLIEPIIKYLIGSILSLNYVTYYENCRRIINFSNGLIASAQKGLFNRLSEANMVGKLKEFVNDSLYSVSKMSVHYSIMVYGLLNVCICYFIFYWFNSYDSVVMYIIYSLSYAFINFGGGLYAVLMVKGKGYNLVIIQVINVIAVFVSLNVSLQLLNSYLGLLGFFVSTLISMVLIFYFINRIVEIDIKSYLKKINFNDIIKLNLLLISQMFLLYYFPKYFNYLQILFVLIYLLVFYKYGIEFYSIIKNKIIKDYFKQAN